MIEHEATICRTRGRARRGAGSGVLLGCVLVLGACQGGITAELFQPDVVSEAEATDADTPPLDWATPEGGEVRAEVALGSDRSGYANDDRLSGVLGDWSGRVERAVERLALVVGLAFTAEVAPRIVLTALGDEGRDFALAYEVEGGRRVPVVRVNAEPIAAGRRDADRVLLEALASAVYEDAALRHAPAPRWVVQAATTVAAGDLDRRLVRLKRDAELGSTQVTVDPTDERAGEATGVAAVLVLLEKGEPGSLRRFFAFTAEGDDGGVFLSRMLRDPVGQWAGAGRALLDDRLSDIDTSPWRLLRGAKRAVREMGRAGMESTLPPVVPGEVAGEIQVLRARAYADEGDFAKARELLGALDADVVARLEDPGGATLLILRAERADGGNPARAEAVESRFRRDYPQRARLALASQPWSDPGGGLEEPTLEAVADRVDELLAAHRSGAARRLLASLGERALAPELSDAHRRVTETEATPSPRAVEVSRHRVRAWREDPTQEHEDAVRDAGAAAVTALVEVLVACTGDSRRDTLRLLVEAGGPGRVVEALVPSWRRQVRLVEGDLDVVLGVGAYAEVHVWTEGLAGDVLATRDADAMWERLRYGLDVSWVREHPSVLRGLRSPDYALRREAFDTAAGAGQVTPELVAHGLADPAPLLRRRAVEVGGRAGFPALVRRALDDEAWMVRQAACSAAASALGADAIQPVLLRFRSDSSNEVRLAATASLLALARKEPALVEALVPGLAAEDLRIQELLEGGLPALDKSWVAYATVRALEAEVATKVPRDPYLARLFRVLQRAIRRDAGWYPGMPPEELRALVGGLPKRLIGMGVLEARGPRR